MKRPAGPWKSDASMARIDSAVDAPIAEIASKDDVVAVVTAGANDADSARPGSAELCAAARSSERRSISAICGFSLAICAAVAVREPGRVAMSRIAASPYSAMVRQSSTTMTGTARCQADDFLSPQSMVGRKLTPFTGIAKADMEDPPSVCLPPRLGDNRRLLHFGGICNWSSKRLLDFGTRAGF